MNEIKITEELRSSDQNNVLGKYEDNHEDIFSSARGFRLAQINAGLTSEPSDFGETHNDI